MVWMVYRENGRRAVKKNRKFITLKRETAQGTAGMGGHLGDRREGLFRIEREWLEKN